MKARLQALLVDLVLDGICVLFGLYEDPGPASHPAAAYDEFPGLEALARATTAEAVAASASEPAAADEVVA